MPAHGTHNQHLNGELHTGMEADVQPRVTLLIYAQLG